MNYSLFVKVIRVAIIVLLAGAFTSCVSMKKYKDLTAKCSEESSGLNAKLDILSTQVTELSSENERYKKDVSQLKADTSRLGSMLRVLTADYNELDRSHELLKSQFSANFEDAE